MNEMNIDVPNVKLLRITVRYREYSDYNIYLCSDINIVVESCR